MLRVRFYLVDKTEDLSLGGSLSDSQKGLFRRRGEPRYTEGFQQRTRSQNIKRLLGKKSQTSQVKEFSTFLCLGRCRGLASLKSFL